MSLYDERASLVAQMRGILDTADSEDRDLSSEETAKYEQIEKDVDSLDEKIAAEEANAARRHRLSERENQRRQPPAQPQLPDPPKPAADLAERQMQAFRGYLHSGGRPGWDLSQELAALQMDSDTGGGTLVMPEVFVQQLIQGLDEQLSLLGVSTIFDVPNADSLGAPSLDNDPADSDWTGELLTGGEDSTMDMGKRILHPHPLAKLLKVSKTLLRRSSMPVDQIVRERLQFKMGVTLEKALLTGTGANQPLGIFTAHADGISTAADVSTDNTTTAITADGLINCLYSLKEQYLRSANLRWVFHRDAIKAIRKLKDGNGQFLWQPGLAGDRANQILDIPYIVSEFAPNTFTTGLYVGAVGDFRFLWVARSLSMQIQVAQELYAATNQDGYFIRSEIDAMPVLEEAFARVTLA